MNQVGGINLVVYYSPTLLTSLVHMDPKTAQVVAGCINIMFPVGSLFPTFMLDRMGRRVTMICGSIGLSISMMLISALLSQGDRPGTGPMWAAASVAFIFTDMFIFGATANCVPWVYVPEILPLKARTRGTAIGISSNWLWNFVIVRISPILFDSLSWKTFLIFMCTNLAFVPLVYYLFPETSNVGLEDVDHFFIGGGDPVKTARMVQREMKAGTYETRAADVHRGSISVDDSSDRDEKKTYAPAHVEKVSSN